jgi:FolB domain-containing protein
MRALIGFEHFKICCIIGCNAEERNVAQEIFVDLRLRADISRCAKSDHLQDAVDYVPLSQLCTDLAQKGQYRLMESLAADILAAILRIEAIEWAWIRIKKPKALSEALYASVELEAEKKR